MGEPINRTQLDVRIADILQTLLAHDPDAATRQMQQLQTDLSSEGCIHDEYCICNTSGE